MHVTSVLGPIQPEELGRVLTHEHLSCDLYRVTRRSNEGLSDPDSVIEDLVHFGKNGGGTIVEVTPPDLGRNPQLLRKMAAMTGVNIIMGSGWYRRPFYDSHVWETPTAQLADELIHDITEGVDGVRPGVIGELGAEGAIILPVEERAHRAAARAHLDTGLGIATHAFRTAVGLAQLDLLEEEGVNPERVLIGHCDSYPDPAYRREIARRGAFVGLDLIRGLRGPETQRQVRTVLDMVEAGHGHRILLSHDVCFHEHLIAYGGKGYSFILTEFRQLLETAGLPARDIESILIENPYRFLTGESRASSGHDRSGRPS